MGINFKMYTKILVLLFAFIFIFINSVNGNECDNLGLIVYEDLGCKPITVKDKPCPVKYDCDLEIKNFTCRFRDLDIQVGQKVPDHLIYGNCYINCHCQLPRVLPSKSLDEEPLAVLGTFNCAILDCPEWIGGAPLKFRCYRNYALDKCCSTGQTCETSNSSLVKCDIKPKPVYLGERFYPENTTCLSCVCLDNFNGKFEEPHCKRVKCASQIRHGQKIADYCAPFYSVNENEKTLCCPDDWVCPSPNDKIITVNPKADQTSELTCRFGKNTLKLGEGLETSLEHWGETKEAICECILPPFLTCKTKITKN